MALRFSRSKSTGSGKWQRVKQPGLRRVAGHKRGEWDISIWERSMGLGGGRLGYSATLSHQHTFVEHSLSGYSSPEAALAGAEEHLREREQKRVQLGAARGVEQARIPKLPRKGS